MGSVDKAAIVWTIAIVLIGASVLSDLTLIRQTHENACENDRLLNDDNDARWQND